jgi:hypothetical protein
MNTSYFYWAISKKGKQDTPLLLERFRDNKDMRITIVSHISKYFES